MNIQHLVLPVFNGEINEPFGIVEIGNIAGPAEWDSEDAIKLINAATAG